MIELLKKKFEMKSQFNMFNRISSQFVDFFKTIKSISFEDLSVRTDKVKTEKWPN